MSRHELTTEDRRRGAKRSAEVRRRRRDRTWADELLERVNADPGHYVSRLLATGNGAALVRGLELATMAADLKLRQRAVELEQRERGLAGRERAVRLEESFAAHTREQREQAESDVEELELRYRELQAAIEREAAEAGLELVEVDE